MKHNLLKSVIISVLLLMGVSNAWGASPIYSIGDVYVTGSMNDWSTNSSDWKLGSGNNCTNTFYLEESETNYTFKLYLKSGYYTVNGYWFTQTTSGPAYSLSTSGNNMEIETKDIDAASGYVKLDFDFWGEYSGDSKLSVTQSAVAALSPSLSANKTALIAADKSTITASCSGGSGSYTYTYKVTCDGSVVTNSTLSATTGASVTFTAPSVTGKKTYTITVTAKDSHALLSGLATKTATKTITVEEAHNVTVSYKYGSTTIKDNTTTSNVKYETESSITAPAITGYKFSSWTLGNGITNKSANTTTNPISITTKSSGPYTLTANYTEDLTSTWHIVGDPTSIFKGTSTWAAHNDNMLRKTTGASTASKGSLTIDVKTLPVNNNSYQFKVLNTNGTTWYGWSTGDNHFWMNTTNTTGVYTDQNNLYFIPNALGDYKFDVDWSSTDPSLKVTFPTAYAVTFGKGTGGSSVTAKYSNTSFSSGTKVQSGKTVTFTQSASAGYTFKEWNTKSDGTGTKLSTNATYTHTVAATNTVYAIYTKKPDKTIYLEPTGYWNPDKAVFQAHVWQTGKTGRNLDMVGIGDPSHADGDNKSPYRYYKVEVPAEYDNILFFRKDNFATVNENAWNKTGDLTIPTDDKALYTITEAGKGKAESYNPAATGTWKAPNFIYTITLGYCDFGTYGIKYNGQSYFSKPDENVTLDVPAGAQIEILEGQPFSNAYKGDVIKSKPTKVELTTGQTLTINGDIMLDDNFVTKTSHVVYLGIPDVINTTEIWAKADKANFIYTWDTYASYGLVASTGSFRIDALGITYYEFTIPEERHSFRFQRKTSLDDKGTPHCESVSLEHEIPLTDVNCFTLKNEKDGNNRYKGTWGVLPAQPGDYRLLYVEQVVEKSKKDGDEWKTIITRKKAHPSNIIRKRTESGVDTVSLHTYKDRKYAAKLEDGSTYESSNNPEIILQKYLGNDQWQDVECQMVYGPLETLPIMANLPGRKNASPSSNIDDLQHQDGIENIKKDVLNHQDKGNGVWNFVVTQDNAGNASVQWNETHRYTGEYYIRTDNAEGGWDQYTLNDNYMTYSQYAKDHSGFSHYFCRWVEKNITPNTKFVIANDHGVAISDTLSGDQFTDIHGNIQEDANIRWSWNMVNNEIARAYIQGTWKAGSQERNRNLVVNYKPSSEGAVEDLLDDSGDWIYQKDFPVKVGSHLNSLTAQYPVSTGSTQTFASNLDMLTGDPAVNDKDYKVRILYDFKINKTLVALVPNANEASIAIDVVIERINQGEATQVQAPIAYSNNQRSGEGSTVYGVMSFDKSHLTDPSLSSQQKLTYWISFPFDVKLSEIFGFGEVGDYWMIKYYDGKDRAAKGLYDDNTFWKFITNRNYTLKANQGYVLALNKKVMDANSPIFTNTTRISLYFPSKEKLLNINTDYTQTTCTIPEYTCTITSPTDRRTKDSNWNFIGVPSFANKNRNTTNENLKYFYDYDYLTDTYSVAINRNSRENTFKSMFAYMVQFAGTIDWSTLASNGSQGLAAKKTDNVEKHVLRIELQQNNTKVDQTYIQLEDEEVTAMFDMNYDLTKLFNSKTNIYSLIPSDTDPIQVAANVMPIEETIIPLGIKLDAAGEYTFAMPDGTDGIVVELIDYDNNTRTNMLLDEYTVNLGKGTFENRFALHVKPNKTTTSVEDINTNTTGVKKYLIDGVLYMQKDGVLYDAQGKLVR